MESIPFQYRFKRVFRNSLLLCQIATPALAPVGGARESGKFRGIFLFLGLDLAIRASGKQITLSKGFSLNLIVAFR